MVRRFTIAASLIAIAVGSSGHAQAQEAQSPDGSAAAPSAAAQPVPANQAPAPANQKVGPAGPDNSGLSEIVVTALRREQSLQDVPVSVTAISAENLQRSSVYAAASLPAIAPALSYTSGAQPSFASFNIRGVGSYVYRIGIQPAVSVVIDGIPLARTTEFAGELGDVERVEVLSGPQGTLFGRNSTGGIVNIVRQRPTSNLEGYVQGDIIAGTQGDIETLIRGTINIPINDSIRLRVHAYNRENSPYLKNYYSGSDNQRAKDSGDHRATGIQGKLEIDLAQNFTALLSGDYLSDFSGSGTQNVLVALQQVQQPRVPNITAAQTELLGPALGDPFAINMWAPFYANVELGGGSLELRWRPSSRLTVASLTSYREAALDGSAFIYNVTPNDPRGFDLLSLGTSAQNPYEFNRVTRWSYFTQEVRANYSSSFADIVGGIYYFHLNENEFAENPLYVSARALGLDAQVGMPTGPSANFPYYYFNNMTRTSDRNSVFAGFGDITIHPMRGLDLFVGYRLSRETLDFTYRKDRYLALPVQLGVNFDQGTWSPTVPITNQLDFVGGTTDTLWSGCAGASYELAPDIRAYASYSHGYIGAGFDAGNSPRGTNADPSGSLIRPSEADNYELGIRTELFDRHLRFNATLFRTDTKDVQVTALVPGTNINIVQNAGDIRAVGVEVDFAARIGNHFELAGGGTYLDAQVRNLVQACYPGQTAAQGCVSGSQSVDGLPALNAPRWKWNVAATYNVDMPGIDGEGYLRAEYQHRGETWYQLDHDPLATDAGYDIINLTLGLTLSQRYEFRLFVNNLTNEYFCNNMVNGPYFRRGCQTSPIDAQRRYGFSARFNF